jgi:hypothetical protein
MRLRRAWLEAHGLFKRGQSALKIAVLDEPGTGFSI